MNKKIIETPTNLPVNFEEPSVCPICNHKISPIYLKGTFHQDRKKFSIYCECTSCIRPFIVLFKNCRSQSQGGYLAEDIEYIAPMLSESKEFDINIEKLSPNFVEIYNQALAAETYGLNQIAGIGYRKALEFLIKDYCIHNKPDEKDEILNILLGQCIDKHLDDFKLKSSAKLSAWLGNDQAHYIKKFEDKDISDLKRYIDTSVYFILYSINADEADAIVNTKN